ncbi:MAG: lipid-A-disaccharide synthase [Pseudobdellovibrionaceae bacterium]
MMKAQVMVVAAEASSALYAERLLDHWLQEKKDVHCFGVGTASMEAKGFERLGKSEEMAVVGIAEVLENYSLLKSVFDSLVEEAKKRRPQFVLVLDYPDFNLRLAKEMKILGIPVVYYVSPQVWAWRKGRIQQIKEYCDQVLLLFPFEKEFYEQAGMKHAVVGHPVVDELKAQNQSSDYRKMHRKRYGLTDDQVVIGLMPGSRPSELKLNFPTQVEAARLLYKKYSNVKIVVLCAPTVDRQVLQTYLEEVRFPFQIIKDEPFEMIHLVDFMIATSGTATLMVGLLEKPMVIMYKLKWLTWALAKVLVRGVKWIGLPNLILQKEAVPEMIQQEASPENLVKQIGEWIDSAEKAEAVRRDLRNIRGRLGSEGVTVKVAQILESYFTHKNQGSSQ